MKINAEDSIISDLIKKLSNNPIQSKISNES